MTTNEIKDEIVKIKSRETLNTLADFCEQLRKHVAYSEPFSDEYDITLTRKVVKEEDFPPVDNPTHDTWSVVYKGFYEGRKIPAIKKFREVLNTGLKEAKEIVEGGDYIFVKYDNELDAIEFRDENFYTDKDCIIHLIRNYKTTE
jgi:ribosomal protein L7/L12